jgi:hypothetical protein
MIIIENKFFFIFYYFSSAICANAPCRNGGTCVGINNNSNYYCLCPQGYTGVACSTLKRFRMFS